MPHSFNLASVLQLVLINTTHTMNKTFLYSMSVLLVASLMLVSCKKKEAPVKEKTFVELNGKLQVKGTQLMNEYGDAVELHGVSFGWDCFHPRFYNDSCVTFLVQDWKANVVRAAMGVDPVLGYLADPEQSVKCVTDVVDAAIKNGVYVIIDFHSHKNHTPEAVKFFTEMAKKYGNNPHVIYEIFNEPDDQCTWPAVKKYSEKVIAAIRVVDPDNIILVGCPRWCQELQLVAADPLSNQSNLMYTMHFYAGTHKQWLRDRTDSAMIQGIPVFISECAGMEATGDGPVDYAEWPAFLNWMDQNHLSWCTWSLSDKAETCSMLKHGASSVGYWPEDDIKEWGKISRTAIQARNQPPKEEKTE
jgi:endoglucanase